MPEKRPWSSEELKYLQTSYHTLGKQVCANTLSRTIRAIEHKADILNLVGPTIWTEEEIATLKRVAAESGFPEAAKALGRTLNSVRLKGSELGFKSDFRPEKEKKDPDLIRSFLARRDCIWVSGEYVGSIRKTLLVKCPRGHEYLTSWNNLQQGRRCYSCFGTPRKTLAEIERTVTAHGFTLISADNYQNNESLIRVECSAGHQWSPRYTNVRSGEGCPSCAGTMSQQQKDLEAFIRSIYPGEMRINDRQAIRPLELDIYLPERKLALEIHGLYWHSVQFKSAKDHLKKHLICAEAGIKLIQIFEDQWRDKRSLLEDMLRFQLGKAQHTLRASKCELVEGSQDEFFNASHLDGSTRAFLTLALKHKDQVVAALSFRKPYTKVHRGRVEIARFAVAPGFRVHGGFSRLLKAAMPKLGDYTDVLTYSDNSLGSGGVYLSAGFKLDGLVTGNYWYTDGKSRIFRFKCRRDPALPGTELQQQTELRRQRIYGAGHRRWLLSLRASVG